jgi:hypothetical protein
VRPNDCFVDLSREPEVVGVDYHSSRGAGGIHGSVLSRGESTRAEALHAIRRCSSRAGAAPYVSTSS